MKHTLWILFWSIVLALVWAAGHDILKGEADVWMEYSVVITSLVAALAALIVMIRKVKPKI